MCGIAGVVSYGKKFKPGREELLGMAGPLKYRGPDQEDYLELEINNSYVSFAHKRLSIIDLSESGKQPMWSPTGNSVIIFNGEIYNYRQIRNELLKHGVSFRTNSDTEVILAAYEIFGIDKALDRIEGMFAFALYDTQKDELFIARDRFGEKPLYYHCNEQYLAFSSDIRSFYELPVNLSVDVYALGFYFSELSTPAENSVWAEISKLPAAHYIHYRKGGIAVRRYWELDYTRKTADTLKTAISRCEELLEASVTRRLVADVPVGTFLSGGIDSSLVTLLAARNYDRKIKTFSVGFEYENYNELPYAREVAALAGSEHFEITVNPMDTEVFESLVLEYGEPFADSSMIPSYYVSKFAAAHVKVVLGGDGGDELFGGYATYNQGYRMNELYGWRSLKLLPSIFLKLKKNEKLQYIKGIFDYDPEIIASALYRNMGFHPDELKKISADEIFRGAVNKEFKKRTLEAISISGNIFDCLLASSIKTRLVNDYFVKVDRASMFASLEVRTPFVDRDLAEYTTSLPHNYLLHNKVNKYLTKKIAEKYFPRDFIYRPKMGFGIPIGEWMKRELKDYFYTHIIEQQQSLVPVNSDYIRKIYADHMAGRADNKDKLWLIYVLNIWAADLRKRNNLNE